MAVPASKYPASWIGKPGQKRNVTLIPLNRLFEERYAIYFRVRG
jgi:hypothetical protein